jgi:hypothetical protein
MGSKLSGALRLHTSRERYSSLGLSAVRGACDGEEHNGRQASTWIPKCGEPCVRVCTVERGKMGPIHCNGCGERVEADGNVLCPFFHAHRRACIIPLASLPFQNPQKCLCEEISNEFLLLVFSRLALFAMRRAVNAQCANGLRSRELNWPLPLLPPPHLCPTWAAPWAGRYSWQGANTSCAPPLPSDR